MCRPMATIFLAVCGLIGLGCGNSSNGSNSGNINGTWSATLTGSPNGTTEYQFTTSFTEQNGGSLAVTNFTFSSAGPCFSSYSSSEYSESGSFGLMGNFNGQVQGTFAMTITTMFPTQPANNVLNLQGTVSGGKITGTWTATGMTGCSGNGNFTAVTG